jgi:hypothetical protein
MRSAACLKRVVSGGVASITSDRWLVGAASAMIFKSYSSLSGAVRSPPSVMRMSFLRRRSGMNGSTSTCALGIDLSRSDGMRNFLDSMVVDKRRALVHTNNTFGLLSISSRVFPMMRVFHVQRREILSNVPVRASDVVEIEPSVDTLVSLGSRSGQDDDPI